MSRLSEKQLISLEKKSFYCSSRKNNTQLMPLTERYWYIKYLKERFLFYHLANYKMNFISIQTPNEPKDIWKVCQIIKLEVNQFKNNGSIHVKGIARSNSVTTLITVNDFSSLFKGEVINSLHGYFKLKLESETTKEWMQEAFRICL